MNETDVFHGQNAILRRAAPHLFAIQWPNYAQGFVLEDEAGHRKYQALMRRCYPSGKPGSLLTTVVETLPDRDKSFETLGRKLNALVQHPQSKTSLGLRNPPHVWGGAIRTILGPAGITGLPEIGDHLTEVHLSWYTGQLSKEDYEGLQYGDHDCVIAARELVGMTLVEWRRLSQHINDIILGAVM